MAMFLAIQNAKQRVWVQTYTLEPDAIGLEVIRLLEDAAERQCEVKLLYDSVGSFRMESGHFERLRRLGASVTAYQPIPTEPWRWSWSFLNRNHRKLLLVDEEIAFCGGMNLSADYAGTAVGGTGYFADTQLMVQGPAAADLQTVFRDSLASAGPRKFFAPSSLSKVIAGAMFGGGLDSPGRMRRPSDSITPTFARSSLVQVLESNVLREKRHIQSALPVVISSANHRCYITSPYFLPPRRIKQALIEAARRGVDVRIITAGLTAVALAKLSGRHLYGLFLKYGIRVYEMKSQALHAKLMVVDEMYTTVGSFNLDVMSSARNLEVSMHILDAHLAQAARSQIGAFIEGSKEISESDLSSRRWYHKVLHWLAYQVSRIPQVYRSPIVGDDVS